MFEAVKKALSVAQFLTGLIPLIRDLITAIEVPGNGALKAEAVVAIVKAVWAAIPEDILKSIGLDKIETFVRAIIDPIVAVLNAAGILKKSTA